MNFTDYDKITDTLMYLDRRYQLNIVVHLTTHNTKSNKINPFHTEYTYNNNSKDKTCYSIRRDINVAFEIKDRDDYEGSVYIRPCDIIFFTMMVQEQIIPWYIGKHRIYSFDNNNQLLIKGKFKPAEFPLSEYKFLRFTPIVLSFADDTYKEGVRITINKNENYVDLDIGKLMEFIYYINNTDLHNAASSMLNYVKTMPYGVNMIDLQQNFKEDSFRDTQRERPNRDNFFDK